MELDLQGNERVEVSTDGVAVKKHVVRTEHTVVELRFSIESAVDAPLKCRVTDSIPSGLGPESVYVHPSETRDEWTVDDELVFDGVIAPGATVEQVVSVRPAGREDATALLESPRIDVARPLRTTETPTDDCDGAERRGLTAALVDELQGGAVSEEDVRLLRDAIGVEEPKSLRTQLGHLQCQMSTFAAYADGLEAFIDEHGTGQELLDRLAGDVERLDERLESIESTVDTVDERLDRTEAALHRVDAVADDLEEVEDRVSDIDEEQSDAISTLSETLSDVERGIADRCERLRTDVNDLHSDVDGVDRDVRRVEDSIDDVENVIDRLRSDVDEGVAWRESVGRAFAGTGPAERGE